MEREPQHNRNRPENTGEKQPQRDRRSESSITKAIVDTSSIKKSTKTRKKAYSGKSQIPQKRGSWAAWLILLACLCLAAAPMFLGLNSSRLTGHEPKTIKVSTASWNYQNMMAGEGMSFERFTPIYRDKLVLDNAPGITWLHMLAFAGFSGGNTGNLNERTIIFDARLVSVIFALLAIVGVFWAGYSLGGTLSATVAALVFIATPVFLRQSHIATAQIPTLAFNSLAIASALWAIRPLRPLAGIIRQAVGWAICGISLAMAVLIGGPLALIPLLCTLIVLVCVSPHRSAHLLGLIAAGCIAILLITPWAIYVHANNPSAWQSWAATLTPTSWNNPKEYVFLLGQRTGIILAIILPWSLWLIGGLIQPFSTSSSGARRKLFIGWSWFITVAVMLLIAPDKGAKTEILTIIPATAVVLGQLFAQYIDLSAQGRHANSWNSIRWIYAILALIGSVAIPALIQFQPAIFKNSSINLNIPEQFLWLYAAGTFVILSILAMIGFYYAMRHHPGRAVGSWALWAVAATTLAIIIPLPAGSGKTNNQTIPKEQNKILVLNHAQDTNNQPIYDFTYSPTFII